MSTIPTYRSLNKILTLMGCERRLMICGMICGAGTYTSLNSLSVGFLVFLLFAVMGYFQAQDPVRLRLIFNASRYKDTYDAGKRNPFHVAIHDSQHH